MEVASDLAAHLKLFCCPNCQSELLAGEGGLDCVGCRRNFEIRDGIPLLFWPNEWGDEREDVTEVVRQFYERTPFPNYDDFDSVAPGPPIFFVEVMISLASPSAPRTGAPKRG